MVMNSITVSRKEDREQSPVALFVQMASKFQSQILVQTGNKTVNAKSIMGVMTLDFTKGSQMEISAEGLDEQEALESITEFLHGNQ